MYFLEVRVMPFPILYLSSSVNKKNFNIGIPNFLFIDMFVKRSINQRNLNSDNKYPLLWAHMKQLQMMINSSHCILMLGDHIQIHFDKNILY